MVICGYLAWAAVLAIGFTPRAGDLALFSALLGCGVTTEALARRDGHPPGGERGMGVIWELPVAIHLPPLYALAVPVVRMALTQWIWPAVPVRPRPARRYPAAYAAAATGLAYGCAAAVFHAVIPAGAHARDYPWNHAALWLLAIACCALTQWAVRKVLVPGSRVPGLLARGPGGIPRGTGKHRVLMSGATGSWPGMVPRESLRNDATESCMASLVAIGIAVCPLSLVVALPLGTLLQRSFRHAELLWAARADAKTGLLNAAAWEREAAAEVARAVRTSTPLAVALLDLDRFKGINDAFGHLTGDEVLRRIAGVLTDSLREYDLAGRFGGEEFVLLLPQTGAVDALRIAERVRAYISGLPIYAPGAERIYVTVSIGIAVLERGSGRELPELLAAADAALYRAKASGRDQVQMISTTGTGPPADLPAPGRARLGEHGTAVARYHARAGAAQLPDGDGLDGLAETASTATTSALPV